GRWNERETFEYRHAANDGFFGCIAKLRRGLFITGFAATDASVLRPDDGIDWIIPTDPATLLDQPRFQKKLQRAYFHRRCGVAKAGADRRRPPFPVTAPLPSAARPYVANRNAISRPGG